MPERVRVLFDERVADMIDPDAEEEMEVKEEEYIERVPPSTQMSEEEREEGDAFTSSSVEVGVTVMVVRVSVLLFVTEKRKVCVSEGEREKEIRLKSLIPFVIDNTGVGYSVMTD